MSDVAKYYYDREKERERESALYVVYIHVSKHDWN